MLSNHDVEDLFEHFKENYLPHCRFLGTIAPSAGLNDASELLLWTIITIGARHHQKHHHRYAELRPNHERLYGRICCEAVQNPLDLQAMLLMCMWPAPFRSQWSDPSWMHLGTAISCARQMGLDKHKDEVFFGTRRAANQLGNFPKYLLKLTWLKCCELDVQMSLWHGNLPTLAASRYCESVTEFCRDPSVPRDIANFMEIHTRTSRYLLLLDETESAQLAWSLCNTFMQDLAVLKVDSNQTWSQENEVVSDTAKLYIGMTTLVTSLQDQEAQTGGHDLVSPYAVALLLSAKDCAVRVVTQISSWSQQPQKSGHDFWKGATPLPGFPKHVSRIMFFAATVLLKYLDSESDRPAQQAQDDARNAFQKAHLFFRTPAQSDEHVRAGMTLEVAGRAIGHRHAQLQSNVTTRMGASIMYNITWLGGLLRGRDKDADYATPVMAAANKFCEGETVSTEGSLPAPNTYQDSNGINKCAGLDDGDPAMQPAYAVFPFGVWDEALYDGWSSGFTEQDFGLWDDPLYHFGTADSIQGFGV